MTGRKYHPFIYLHIVNSIGINFRKYILQTTKVKIELTGYHIRFDIQL